MRKKAFFNIGLAIIVMSVIFFSQSCTRTEDDMDDPPRQDVGDTLWIQDIQRDSFFILGASLALSPDQKTFYYAEGGGNVYWTGTRIVARDVAYYYSNIGGPPEDLIAVESGSGNMLWSLQVENVRSGGNNIVINDEGNLLCAFKKTSDSDRRLHIIDAESSEIIWTSSATAESGNKWVGMDGTVYQWFQFEGGMNAFTMPSGDRQVFSTDFGAQHLGAINDKNQLVAINGNITPSKLTVYNSDGSTDWDVSINGMANFPMLITDNGIIIGIINDHPVSFIPKKLVAIQGNAKLAVDGWPRISHDNRNTSNWNK